MKHVTADNLAALENINLILTTIPGDDEYKIIFNDDWDLANVKMQHNLKLEHKPLMDVLFTDFDDTCAANLMRGLHNATGLMFDVLLNDSSIADYVTVDVLSDVFDSLNPDLVRVEVGYFNNMLTIPSDTKGLNKEHRGVFGVSQHHIHKQIAGVGHCMKRVSDIKDTVKLVGDKAVVQIDGVRATSGLMLDPMKVTDLATLYMREAKGAMVDFTNMNGRLAIVFSQPTSSYRVTGILDMTDRFFYRPCSGTTKLTVSEDEVLVGKDIDGEGYDNLFVIPSYAYSADAVKGRVGMGVSTGVSSNHLHSFLDNGETVSVLSKNSVNHVIKEQRQFKVELIELGCGYIFSGFPEPEPVSAMTEFFKGIMADADVKLTFADMGGETAIVFYTNTNGVRVRGVLNVAEMLFYTLEEPVSDKVYGDLKPWPSATAHNSLMDSLGEFYNPKGDESQ